MDASAGTPIVSPSSAVHVGDFQVPLPGSVTPVLETLLAGQSGTLAELQDFEDQLTSARLGVVNSLFRALRAKHPPTARHCLRVALGCSAFSRFLQLESQVRGQIELAALLHDVGKIGVPDHILNKPSRLDADEVSVMERHHSSGVQILEAVCGDSLILDHVRWSSTWYDGSRPGGNALQGEAIPLGARIISILDAFDAMTTDVVYRRARSQDRALAELFQGAARQFDPQLVAAFAQALTSDASLLCRDYTRQWVDMTLEAALPWSLQSTLTGAVEDTQQIFQRRLLETMHDGVIFVDLSGRVLVWNRGAERLTGLSAESIHHKTWEPRLVDLRDSEGNLVRPSHCPLTQCLKTFSQGMHRMTITRNDQRVAVNVHVVPVRDTTGACHGATMLLHDVSPEESLEQRVQNLHEKATTDPLTGVSNRAEFDRWHKEFVTAHLETGQPCSMIIADIDHFKSINDKYGHQAGDEALIAFAKLIQQRSRMEDVVARYGGEEFVVLCPGCGNESATRKAEEIRRELAATSQSCLSQRRMTASFGVTELQPGDSPETMLRRADRALYQAKETGRDRVVQLGAGMDPAPAPRQAAKRASWFSWLTKAPGNALVRRTLRSNVPENVVAEKVRGFISDHEAEVVEIRERFIVIAVDERRIAAHRRRGDRPAALTIELEFKPETIEVGRVTTTATRIDVKVCSRRQRDRRGDVARRADQLVNSLKCYLIAEDVAST